jgi:hypothetical protein
MFDDEQDDYPDDEDDGEPYPPSVNGPNGLRIMREQCSTCIFRPGNLMQLNRGRLADMVQLTRARDTNVVCHQTLGEPFGAMCRGSVDERAGQLVRIAERLNAVELVDAPKGGS